MEQFNSFKIFNKLISEEEKCISLKAMLNRYANITFVYIFSLIVLKFLIFIFSIWNELLAIINDSISFNLHIFFILILDVLFIERLLYSIKSKNRLNGFLKWVFIFFNYLWLKLLLLTYFPPPILRNMSSGFAVAFKDSPYFYGYYFLQVFFNILVVLFGLFLRKKYYAQPKKYNSLITIIINVYYRFFIPSFFAVCLEVSFFYLPSYDEKTFGGALISFLLLTIGSFVVLNLISSFIVIIIKRRETNVVSPSFNTVHQTYHYINNDMILGSSQVDFTWYQLLRKQTVVSQFQESNMFNSGNAKVVPYCLINNTIDHQKEYNNNVLLYCLNNTTPMKQLFNQEVLTKSNIKRIYNFLNDSIYTPIIYDASINSRFFNLLTAIDNPQALILRSNSKETDNISYKLPFFYSQSSFYKIPDIEEKNLVYLNAISSNLFAIDSTFIGFEDKFTKKTIKLTIDNIKKDGDAITYFYGLLKMAEFLLQLISFNDVSPDVTLNIDRITIGKLKMMINDVTFDKTDNINRLNQSIKYLRKTCNNTSKYSYLKISEIVSTIANLRNHFLGHGVMIYSINPEIVYHLSQVVLFLSTYYKNNYKIANYTNHIHISSLPEIEIDLFKKVGDDWFMFSGADKTSERLTYINFISGEIKIFVNDKESNIVVGCEGKLNEV